MPEIVLRPAVAADGGAIARVQLAAWRATYGHLNPAMVGNLDLERTAGNWARAATDPGHRLQVAELDDTMIGYAFSGPAEGQADHVGELDAVYLLPSAQGLGVGRLLVEDALYALAASGHTECLLWVADDNAHARGFTNTSASKPTAAVMSGGDCRSSATAGRYRQHRPDSEKADAGIWYRAGAGRCCPTSPRRRWKRPAM
jgi:GNAT superfamily N-acetyltransferase